MVLYGPPDGPFESTRNDKDPAGIVVVWETLVSISPALAGEGSGGSVFALVHLPCYA